MRRAMALALIVTASGCTYERQTVDWSGLDDRPVECVVFSLEKTHPNVVRFSPDGMTVACLAQNNSIHLWDVAGKRRVREIPGTPQLAQVLAFRADGEILAVHYEPGKNRGRLLEATTGLEVARLLGDVGLISALSPDLKWLATACDNGDIDLWDTADGAKRRTLSRHKSFVNALAFSPDGRLLLACDYSREIRLWDVQSGRAIRDFGRHVTSGMAFSPDGRIVALGDRDENAGREEQIGLYEVATGRKILAMTPQAPHTWCLAFSPDGRLLVSAGGGGMMVIFDSETGLEIRRLRGHTQDVSSICFSPDGRTLASASRDGTIRLWRLRD